MNLSNTPNFLQRILDYVQMTPWLNSVVQVLLIVALGYALYRLMMSPWAANFRQRISFLKAWHGKREITNLIGAGEYAQAGDHLIALGHLDQAIDVFQKGNLFGRAADVYLQKRNLDKAAMFYERAGEYGKAAEIYLDRKQYERAEANYERLEKLEELGDLYQEREEYQLAANVYLRTSRPEKAAEMLVALDKPKEAANMLVEAFKASQEDASGISKQSLRPKSIRLATRAAALYEKGELFNHAAELYLEVGKSADAARCFQKGGQSKRAADLFEEAGDLSAASDLLKESGDRIAAARLEAEELVQSGDHLGAIGKFQEAGEFHRAADIYRELNEIEKAATMYQKAREFSLAASLYKEAGRWELAARMYERAEAWQEAIHCYGEANLTEKQAGLYEKIGDFIGLAANLHRRELSEDALEALDQVKEIDPSFRSALSLRGQILLDQGEPLKAKEFFEQSIRLAEHLSSPDIDTIYNLAIAADQAESESSALQILERMLAQDLIDPPAVEKAQKVRKLLNERAFTRMSRMTSIPSGSRLFANSEKEMARQEDTAPKGQRYVKIKEIGRGGMGVVYTARDTTLDRVVALKVLSSSFKQHEQAVKTFLREAKAAASLNHPNIVTVHDAGTQEGDYYIAMELIDGKTIKEILRTRGKLKYSSVLEVLHQLLAALQYAHSRSVVHRDLTTNNIMWTRQKTIKIMDFGLAKIIKELLTEQSIVGGTPSFMSPEQTLGKPIDHRTDIYSFGICVFEMLLGELPFTKGDLGYHHLHTPPPIPKERDPNIPAELNLLILRCMEKDPENRFQKIKEIQELLAKMNT